MKPNVNLKELQPVRSQYEKALAKNAELLQELGDVLNGNKWMSDLEMETILRYK